MGKEPAASETGYQPVYGWASAGHYFRRPGVTEPVHRLAQEGGLEINTRLNPAVILLAVLLIVAFVAIFSRRHKWDQHELHYRELLAKRGQDREDTQKNDPEIASAPAAKQED
ncbi:MAG TPA: hypothetical protein VD996_16435 [Chitinophagaceae bacterium]|nr:hypothetical protein [Chitinophagaceae bacterium]